MSLNVRFSGLYDLAERKLVSVADMHLLGWGWKGKLGSGVDVSLLAG